MTIAFGGRRLFLSLISGSGGAKSVNLPATVDATDAELARLNSTINAAENRRRWEASAVLYGGMRQR
jgi:hypothetical protein